MSNYSFYKKNFHIPVMLSETIKILNTDGAKIYADFTLGGGSHLAEIARKNCPCSTILGVDIHKSALLLNTLKYTVKKYKNIKLFHDSFSHIKELMCNNNIKYLNGFICDLGISYNQIINTDTFSLIKLNNLNKIKITSILKSISYNEFKNLFNDMKNTFNIKKMYKYIRIINIANVNVVLNVLKTRFFHQYVALKHKYIKLIDRKLRAKLNEENKELVNILLTLNKLLSDKGKGIFISFNKIEDSIIKNFFSHYTNNTIDIWWISSMKPIIPNNFEIFFNKCSKTAKLRYIKKQ